MPHKRLLLTLAFGIVPLFPLPASALGIGEVISQPRLGERLRIEIRLITGSDERIDPACLELTQGDTSDDLPWVRGARVRVENGPRPKAIIESNEVVSNPIYLLGLKAVCDGSLSREFTLMPQAPLEFSGSSAAGTASRESVERQPSTAGASSGQTDRLASTTADQRPPESSRAKSEGTPKRTKKTKPPSATPGSSRNNATQPAPSADHAPANQTPADRLVVGGGGEGEPNLRFSTQLDDSRSRGLSEAQREQLRQEQRLVAELDEKIVSSLALAEKIRNMEGYLEKLQADMAQLDHNIQTVKNGTGAPRASTPDAVPSASSNAKSAVAAPAPKAESEWALYAAGAAAGLLAIGGLLWQRRRRAEADHEEVQFDEPVTEEPVEAESAEVADNIIELDKPLDLRLSEGPVDENAHISVAEHDSALELAEIMLSFGRVQGAAQTLSDYIASSPRQSIKPWLKLLAIYREAGMQTEFTELATRMHQTFNVQPIGWDDFAGPASRTSIEDLQHLIEPIVAHWRTRPCLEYLRHLLLDNREGTRGGFSLGVADDISVLVSVLETELFPAPAAA